MFLHFYSAESGEMLGRRFAVATHASSTLPHPLLLPSVSSNQAVYEDDFLNFAMGSKSVLFEFERLAAGLQSFKSLR